MAVPAVMGLTQAAAETAITAANLVVGTVTSQHDDRISEGQILSQSPAAQVSVEEGTSVDLVVSLGPVLLPTLTLSAEPEEIPEGGSITLTWNTTNADSVSIDLHGRPIAVALSGSMTFGRISTTTTYTVTATGPGGTVTESVTVTIQVPSTLPIINLSASPSMIDSGGSTTLTWTTTNADSVSIDLHGRPIPVALNGSMRFDRISSTTTYTFTATGPEGTATASATVTVGPQTSPPMIWEFKADPSKIIQGRNSRLKWVVSGASSLFIDNGIGAVVASWGGGGVSASPSETTTYTMTAVGPGGTSTASATVNVSTGLIVSISNPSNNYTIKGNAVTVSGTIDYFSSVETGVTANSLPGLVDGDIFVVNNVPLEEGENTISVVAVDVEGNADATGVIVWADTTGEQVTPILNRKSGTVPFEAILRVDASFGFVGQPIITYDGPGVVDVQLREDHNTFDISVTTPGLYTLTTRVYDNKNMKTYWGSISLLVYDKTVLDALLMEKWNAMKQYLVNQDVESALEYFLETSQNKYRAVFSSLLEQLPQLMTDMQDIELIYMVDGVAKYRLNRDHIVDGSPSTITYYLYFRTDNDGLWKIDQF